MANAKGRTVSGVTHLAHHMANVIDAHHLANTFRRMRTRKHLKKPAGVTVNGWAKTTGVPEATVRRYLANGIPKRPSAATRCHLRALGVEP